MPSPRVLPLALASLLGLLLSACGEEGKGGAARQAAQPPPPGKPVRLDQRSDDAAIAAIQDKIQARVKRGEIDRAAKEWRTRLPLRPSAKFTAKDRAYLWTLTTSEGPIRIRLRPDLAPGHVANVVYLTLLGFYDGLTFHRIVPGRAAEGGDPAGDGKGSPGYAFEPEITEANHHDRPGLVSATGVGGATDDSKFRITFAPDPTLDATGTIFGEVEVGMDVLERLEAAGSKDGLPRARVVIQSAEVSIR